MRAPRAEGAFMSTQVVFVLQLLWFTIAWTTIARLVVWPWSQRLPAHQFVALWIAPQMFRVLGLGLLVPNLAPGMPMEFAAPTAIGDSATALLALCAFVLLQKNHSLGRPAAWAASVVGITDGLHALSMAARLGVAENRTAQWYVPALGIPLMAAAHVGCIAALLATRARNDAQASA